MFDRPAAAHSTAGPMVAAALLCVSAHPPFLKEKLENKRKYKKQLFISLNRV